jgi:hypothetical protein
MIVVNQSFAILTCQFRGRPKSTMWALVIAVAGVACAQEPPNMHELECAIHTFAHAYGVSKVRTNCLLKLLLKPERQCCMIMHAKSTGQNLPSTCSTLKHSHMHREQVPSAGPALFDALNLGNCTGVSTDAAATVNSGACVNQKIK